MRHIKLFEAFIDHDSLGKGEDSLPETVVDIVMDSPTHQTLLAAVKAAGLAEMLSSESPLTVFAPTDEAFAKFPPRVLQSLLQPESKAELAEILSGHVVRGFLTADSILNAIKQGEGVATLETLGGGKLSATLQDGKVVLTDETGKTSTVMATDLSSGNGIVHVIDSVVLPG